MTERQLAERAQLARALKEMGSRIRHWMRQQPPLCDFCSVHENNPPTAFYPCKNFQYQPSRMTLLNDWAACKECDQLIQAENLSDLIIRSVDTYLKRYGLYVMTKGGLRIRTRLEIKNHVTQIHIKFWNHRTGERKEVRKDG